MSSYISPFLPEAEGTEEDTFDLHLGGSTWLKGFHVQAQIDLSDILADNGYNVFDHIGQHMGWNDESEIEDTTRPVVQWYIRAYVTEAPPEIHDDLDDLWQKINKHPDYRGGVIWSVEDVKMVAEEHGVSADALDAKVDMSGWEDVSTEDGFEISLYPLARRISADMKEEGTA